MQFCRDCANMLYPMEEDDRLLYVCRTCPHKELADELRVHYHAVQAESTMESMDVQPENMTADPTLPRARVRCPQCQSTEAVWLQDQEGETSEKMVLTFICLTCHAHWQN